ncbi:uncharacterized protein LOC107608829 isoform X2 [Arachis ipaensis]|uniref:uncharacterized protein LOC107608829 isoform X2 n=1 Tax=Arachis ipaensis TaxID=130454 RepID=UPI000A2B279D|nr:uncharacterized protein LOC107608829 isoform X2 [Arachis ipaensis]
MALPSSFATTTKSSVFSKLQKTSFFQHNQLQRANVVTVVKCESKDSSEDNIELQAKGPKLEIGSPIIFTEAPKMIKTAASVPCLRVNSGLVKPGDVGSLSWRNKYLELMNWQCNNCEILMRNSLKPVIFSILTIIYVQNILLYMCIIQILLCAKV